MQDLSPSPSAADTPASLLRHCPAYTATPLSSLPALAAALGIAAVLVKDEGRRPLGSFKALGGVYAALRSLGRASGLPVAVLLDPARRQAHLPALVCASDGNHGLAVAAAARLAGATAQVFLPAAVTEERAARIAAKGAKVLRVAGTYDDAVRAAAEAARSGHALLIADTTADGGDPVVADVMAGYAVIADEIRVQLAEADGPNALTQLAPTHLFVQAGVGGLAAAIADGLLPVMAPPARLVVVEPDGAACVAAALAVGRPVTVPGELDTVAEMLACGEASAPALAILQRHRAATMSVDDAMLREAPAFLLSHGGPRTTPSGASGLAGLRQAVADPALARTLGLNPASRALLFVTEASPA